MLDQASAGPAYDLGHYLRPVRRHRAVMVVALIAGLALGAAYTVAKGKTYTSTAAVFIDPAPTLPGQSTTVNPANGRTNGAINVDSEAQLVKSTNVLNDAVTTLNNGSTAGGLRGRLDIVVPPNSTILHISCTGSTPTSSQSCASAVASAYLKNRQATETATINRAIAATTRLLGQNAAALRSDASAIQNSVPSSIARNNAFSRQTSDTAVRNSLSGNLNSLQTADTTPGVVISAAGRGTAGKIGLITGPIAGLIIGAIAGLGIVFTRERRDKFVRNSDDLLRYGVPLIASSDRTRDGARSAASERAARTRFEQRIASVVAGAFDDDGGVVYIAPVSPQQSPDRIARRLASTLASVGHSVELVRADDVDVALMAARSTPRAVEAPTPTPRTTAESDRGTDLGWPGASTLAAEATPAPLPAPVAQPLADDSFATDPAPMSIPQLIAEGRRRAQFVIIEGEAAATDAQAYILTGLSDAALLIVDPQVTTRQDLSEVVDQVSVTGSELLGAVMWHLGRKARKAEDAASDGATTGETSGPRSQRQSNDGEAAAPPRSIDAAR